ncbi:MAG: hypothetical protein ACM3QS_00380 [Bacteroidota bacterium]
MCTNRYVNILLIAMIAVAALASVGFVSFASRSHAVAGPSYAAEQIRGSQLGPGYSLKLRAGLYLSRAPERWYDRIESVRLQQGRQAARIQHIQHPGR